MKKENKEKIRILTIVSVAAIALVAIILQGLGLRGGVSAIKVGKFISSLFIFTAAIMLAVSNKELVSLGVVIFSETLPTVIGFISGSYNTTAPFGDSIKNNPYGFASLFIFIYLLILLILVLRFKAFTRATLETRKWAFIPPLILAVFVIVFIAVRGQLATDSYSNVMQVFSILFAIMYLSYIPAAILSVGTLLLIPFHIGQYANNDLYQKDGYVISYWIIGLIMLLLSIAWLVYEIIYFFKNRKKL